LNHWPITLLGGASALCNLLLPILMSRWLAADDIGIFKQFFLYLTLIPALSLGSGLTNGCYLWGSQPGGRQKLSAAFTLAILTSSALAILLVLAGLKVYGLNGIVISFGLSCIAQGANPILEAAFVSQGKTMRAGVFNLSLELIRLLAVVGTVLLRQPIEVIFYSHSIAVLLKLLIASNMIRFSYSNLVAEVKEILNYSLPVSLASGLDLLVQGADRYILVGFLTTASYALYTFGCLMVPPLFVFEQAVNQLIIPKLNRNIVARELNAARELIRNGMEELAFFLIPCAAVLSLFSQEIITLLFTDKYLGAAQYLQIFAVYYAFLAIPQDLAARATQDSRWILKTAGIFGPTALLCSLVAAHFWSAKGALFAFILIQGARRLYALYYLHRRFGWSLASIFPSKSFFLITVISILSGLFAHHFSGSFQLLSTKIVGGFLAFSLVYLFLSSFFLMRLVKKFLGAPLSKLVNAKTSQNEATEPAKKLNIMHLIWSADIGGSERMLLNLIGQQSNDLRLQTEVFVYQTSDGPLRSQFEKANVPIYFYGKGGGFSLSLILRIATQIRDKEIDILHTHDLGSLIYGVLAKFCLKSSFKLVHTQHTFHHLSVWKYGIYERIFPHFADRIIAVSGPLAEKYRTLGVPAHKLEVINNGILFKSASTNRVSAIQKKLALCHQFAIDPSIAKKNWVINLGRIDPIKGQDYAVSLWRDLSQESRNRSALFLIGPFSTEQYEKTIKGQAATEIFFPGPTLEPELWLSVADLFFSASTFEGMSIAGLEAVAAEIPMLLSEIPGHKYFDGIAQYFPLKDIPAATVILEKHLAALPLPYSSAAQRIRSKMELDNGAAKMAESYFKAYHSVCANRRL
jgi:L-malate glycosyltransferase